MQLRQAKNRIRTSALQFEDWQLSMRRAVAGLGPDIRSCLIEYVVRESDNRTKTGRLLTGERAALEMLIENEPEPLVLTKILEAAWLQEVRERHLDRLYDSDVHFFDRLEARSSIKLPAGVTVIDEVGRRRYARPAGFRYRLPSVTSEVLCLLLATVYRLERFYLLGDGVWLGDPKTNLVQIFSERHWIPTSSFWSRDYRKSMLKWFFCQLAHLEFRASGKWEESRITTVDCPTTDVYLKIDESGQVVETPDPSQRMRQMTRTDYIVMLPPFVAKKSDNEYFEYSELHFSWFDAVDLAFVARWEELHAELDRRRPDFLRVFLYSERTKHYLRQVRELVVVAVGFLAISVLCGRCGC